MTRVITIRHTGLRHRLVQILFVRPRLNTNVRRLLQFVALVAAAGALAFWALTGANRGWTKTSVARMSVDEVTGIESPTYEEQFVPGMDFLGAAVLGAGILAGVSFLFRRKPTTQN